MAMIAIGGRFAKLAAAPFHALFFSYFNPEGQEICIPVGAITKGLILATATCTPEVGAWFCFNLNGTKSGYKSFLILHAAKYK